MAQYNRIEVALQMKNDGIVPVFNHSNIEICKKVLRACYDGGCRIFEFTNRGDFAHEIFSELNKYAIKDLPGLILGTGTVIDAPTAALYIQLGSNFIVSPLLNTEMTTVCNRRKVLWIPGCGSVSEINLAHESGAEIIKIFPASEVGGPKFVKAVKGPLPWANLMPSGEVTPEKNNLKDWFDSGATCVGMGGQLITKEILKNNDFEALKNKVKDTLKIIKEIRKEVI